MVPVFLALESRASLFVRGTRKLLGTLVLQSQETAQGGERMPMGFHKDWQAYGWDKMPVSLPEGSLSLSEWFQGISLITHLRLPFFTLEVGTSGVMLVTS